MLTGHGVFGEYLLKIGREVTSICHHRREEEDTLEFCPARHRRGVSFGSGC
jgi:hypothetical protein